jgi:hypothetical protein
MTDNKGILFASMLLLALNIDAVNSYYYTYRQPQGSFVSNVSKKNSKNIIIAVIIVGSIAWWKKNSIIHGLRSLKHQTDDIALCYQCQQYTPTAMGDCGYGLCRNCFIEFCRLPTCATQECTEAYCDNCMLAHQKAWFQSYFEWKRAHCPTCYAQVKFIPETKLE